MAIPKFSPQPSFPQGHSVAGSATWAYAPGNYTFYVPYYTTMTVTVYGASGGGGGGVVYDSGCQGGPGGTSGYTQKTWYWPQIGYQTAVGITVGYAGAPGGNGNGQIPSNGGGGSAGGDSWFGGWLLGQGGQGGGPVYVTGDGSEGNPWVWNWGGGGAHGWGYGGDTAGYAFGGGAGGYDSPPGSGGYSYPGWGSHGYVGITWT